MRAARARNTVLPADRYCGIGGKFSPAVSGELRLLERRRYLAEAASIRSASRTGAGPLENLMTSPRKDSAERGWQRELTTGGSWLRRPGNA